MWNKGVALLIASFVTAATCFQQAPARHAFRPRDNHHRPSITNSLSATTSSNDFFQNLADFFSKKGDKVSVVEKPKIPDVVVDSDFSLSYLFVAIGLVIAAIIPSPLNGIASFLHIFLATFFAIQAKRIRFVFDENAFELRTVDLMDSEVLKDSGENIVVGGANRWDYKYFVNYDFFPSLDFPILVYFKETQTPKELWGTAAGQYDKRNNGQIHFFPAIANCKQLQEQFQIRGCAKVPRD